MAFINYRIDEKAHNLVQNFYQHKDVRSQVFKMRTTVAYGLERFWGEQWRFKPDPDPENPTTVEGYKHKYWKDVWDQLVETMANVGIDSLPNEELRLVNNKFDESKVEDLAKEVLKIPRNSNLNEQQFDDLRQKIRKLDRNLRISNNLILEIVNELWNVDSTDPVMSSDLAQFINTKLWGQGFDKKFDTYHIRAIADQIWAMKNDERKIAQAILLQLCDSLIWWTQRYKKLAPDGGDDDE